LDENNKWPLSTWSVFMQEIRTNNDTEGWHTRLHKLAGLLNQSGMNMYSLIELLHQSQFKYIISMSGITSPEGRFPTREL
jgi:hypothetical protein